MENNFIDIGLRIGNLGNWNAEDLLQNYICPLIKKIEKTSCKIYCSDYDKIYITVRIDSIFEIEKLLQKPRFMKKKRYILYDIVLDINKIDNKNNVQDIIFSEIIKGLEDLISLSKLKGFIISKELIIDCKTFYH